MNLTVNLDSGRANAALGRKGRETRARLLAATRELLKLVSPVQLTVAAIAKQTKMAPATLYVYFDDVQDVLYALSVEAGVEFVALFETHAQWFCDPSRLVQDAQEFVGAFNRLWDSHCHVLQYRNLESDRGNVRFQDLRTAESLPLVERLAAAARLARPHLRRREAYADAVVLYASVERLAATRHQAPSDLPRLPPEELSKAQARIIAQYLKGDGG